MDGNFVSWFATKFDDVDEKAIGIQFGDSASQQVADSLSLWLCYLEFVPGYRKRLPI